MMTAALTVENLTKSYGAVQALRGVDLTIRRGEVVGLLGRNGAGKTTLASIIAGLIRPDGGRVLVHGIDASVEPATVRAQLGYAPQEIGIYPTVTVRENLAFFGALMGLRGRGLKQRCEEVADGVSLTELMSRRAHALSGGEKRRLHVAMALMGQPSLLLLDEPTAGVDTQTRHKLSSLVKMVASQGTAVCYSTHYLREVEELNASVAIIEGGQVIARGTLDEVVGGNSRPSIEILVDEGFPVVDLPFECTLSRPLLRVFTPTPAADLPVLIKRLGAAAQHVKRIEVLEPSLEGVYLALTGRRYVGNDELRSKGPGGQAHAP
jgi:ABC-2 type transport system ATP-binding protein